MKITLTLINATSLTTSLVDFVFIWSFDLPAAGQLSRWDSQLKCRDTSMNTVYAGRR